MQHIVSSRTILAGVLLALALVLPLLLGRLGGCAAGQISRGSRELNFISFSARFEWIELIPGMARSASIKLL